MSIKKCFVIVLLAVLKVAAIDEQQIEVSELPAARFEPPKCDYTVRRGGPDGKVIDGRVSIGDPLYHRWSCASTGGIYCIMVHSCSISHSSIESAKNKRVEIIDEFGCSVYPELVPNMDYPTEADAGLKVNAFLIDIDQISLAFKCSLKFLVKQDGFCRRPKCSRR
uniref:ZP domain-containing protein n=1 Tax=Panagrellus redivivus TaxID=6233 RepID=A0A7E4VCD4_PANRE